MKPLRLPYHILPILYGVYIAVTFLQPVTAQGATYYVATTGNDSNSGTSSSPWRHPQRCTTSPIRAGDTCIVRSGTYTDTDGNGVVVWVYDRPTTPSGTASQPITIKSEKPLGAAIVVPSNRNGYGFMSRSPTMPSKDLIFLEETTAAAPAAGYGDLCYSNWDWGNRPIELHPSHWPASMHKFH